MTKLTLVAFFATILSFTTNANYDYRLFSTVKPTVKEFPEKAQLSAAYIKNGKIYFAGLKKTKNSIELINNKDSVFEIGEITKIFTSVVLSNYVVEGKVNLDDKVKDHTSMYLHKNFTFKQLANHHSGLDRNAENMLIGDWTNKNPYANYTNRHLREYFKSRFRLVSRPGKNYLYSDIGYGLLGKVLSTFEAKPIHQLIKEKIFEKYNMSESCFEYERCNQFMVQPYDGLGRKTNYWSFQSSMCAMGGMRSTAEDMANFLVAHFNSENRELILCTKKTAQITESKGIGLGWKIVNNSATEPVCVSKGKTAGFSSIIGIDMSKGTAVVLLSNQILVDLEGPLLDLL